MFNLTQSEYLSKTADGEVGNKGASTSQSADLSDITSVLGEINEKVGTIIERMELIEDKIDNTEIEEEERQYRDEVKEILRSINEKEMEVNIDLQDLKVSDEKNQEILEEIQDAKNIMIDNINMAKDFVGIGFGVLLGLVVGYVILRFLGR